MVGMAGMAGMAGMENISNHLKVNTQLPSPGPIGSMGSRQERVSQVLLQHF